VFGALKTLIYQIKTDMNTGDWINLEKNFGELKKALEKGKSAWKASGVPKSFIKTVIDVDARIKSSAADAEETKMSFAKNKAFNTLKHNMKKDVKTYAEHIKAYQLNPLADESSSSSDSDSSSSDSDSDSDGGKVKKGGSSSSSSSASSGSESDSGEESFDDSDSSDDDEKGKPNMYTREFWLKKPDTQIKDKEKESKPKPKKEKKKDAAKQVVAEAPKVEEKELNAEQMQKKLQDLLARGKKAINRASIVSELESLATKARDPVAALSAQVHLVTAYLEMNLNKRGVHMDTELWRKAVKTLQSMLNYLTANTNLRLSEDEQIEEQFESEPDEEDEAIRNVMVGMENQEARDARRIKQKEAQEAEERKNVDFKYIQGNFYAFLYRIHVEYVRSLQNIDAHTTEYIDRLSDESSLVQLCFNASAYYARINKLLFQCKCSLIHLELIYSQFHVQYLNNGPRSATPPACPVDDLSNILYKHGDPRQKTLGLLYHLYFLAAHNYFDKARDLMLMSHIQDRINESELHTRILFNRAMAQLGFAAFRTGDYTNGLNCLADLHNSTRIKELLGQGVSRTYDRDDQQEKEKKRQQHPYHTHINIDTLESVHLIGGMFAECDNIATGNSRKVVSKIFRKFYDYHKQAAFNAPAENTRDLIMHATRKLIRGDWRGCRSSIMALRMWTYMPNAPAVKALLTSAIKENALRMYLMVFGSSYVSLSLPSLQDMFELPQETVVRIASKMMVVGDIQGVWDQPSQTLVMHAVQPTRLQKAAEAVLESKAMNFVEHNSRLVDQRNGTFFQTKSDSKRTDRRQKGNSGFRDRNDHRLREEKSRN